MFSVNNFYNVLNNNLLRPLDINSFYFYPFGSLNLNHEFTKNNNEKKLSVIFWDQEPFSLDDYQTLFGDNFCNCTPQERIIANSDINKDYSSLVPSLQWYYFFHGFASLYWYNDLKYYSNVSEPSFTKLFITANRLITKGRAYRLGLVADLFERGLNDHGLVSCRLSDEYGGSWKQEIFRPDTLLDKQHSKLVYKIFKTFNKDLNLDYEYGAPGFASAEITKNQIDLFSSAFINIVTETVYYKSSLHLTEKIFRPIVLGRPFILAGAPHNLVYLKSYGFKTFDKWFDEGYDSTEDHSLRLTKIVDIIDKLSKLNLGQLKEMYIDMLPVIEYNRQHFYNEFKNIIVSEMLDNFESVVKTYNSPLHDISKLDFQTLKMKLSS
jgi:hypothetical protein